MIILWFVVGLAAATIAFFIPGKSAELWPELNAVGPVIIVYLLGLTLYTLRSPITLRARIVSWSLIVLVGGALFNHWTGFDEESHWQHDQLLRIHSVITRGIIGAQVPDALLKTLSVYHKQVPTKKETLGRVFRRVNNGAEVGTNIHTADSPEDSLTCIVQSLADNQIVILGLHSYSRGRKPDFKNANGRVGMIQEKYTLTEKGMTYESEN